MFNLTDRDPEGLSSVYTWFHIFYLLNFYSTFLPLGDPRRLMENCVEFHFTSKTQYLLQSIPPWAINLSRMAGPAETQQFVWQHIFYLPLQLGLTFQPMNHRYAVHLQPHSVPTQLYLEAIHCGRRGL